MMEYRLYLANLVSDLNKPSKKKSALSKYIREDGSGQGFWERGDQITSPRLTLVLCESAVHDAIEQDPEVTAVSSRTADKEQFVRDHLTTEAKQWGGIIPDLGRVRG